MSRFSRKTATGMGYLLFASIGAAGYWCFKFQDPSTEVLAQKDRTLISLPVLLGPSVDHATELSAVATPAPFNDPVVDLSGRQMPTWAANQSVPSLKELVTQSPAKDLPSEYPHNEVRPVTIPRRGDAIIKEPKTVLSLAPQSVGLLPTGLNDGVSSNQVPLVPINSSVPEPPNLAATESRTAAKPESWPDRGIEFFKEIGQKMMNPPPQSHINRANSIQRVVVHQTPVEASTVERASATSSESNGRMVVRTAEPQYIIQPMN